MFTLYELNAKYRLLLDMLSDGVATEEMIKDTLDSIDDAIEDKAENYVTVIRQLQADQTQLADEIKRLSDRKASLDKSIDRMKEALREAMHTTNKDKIKTAKNTIWLQENPPKLIVDPSSEIPSYYYEQQEPKLNRAQLKKDIADGTVAIEGVSLVSEEGVRFK